MSDKKQSAGRPLVSDAPLTPAQRVKRSREKAKAQAKQIRIDAGRCTDDVESATTTALLAGLVLRIGWLEKDMDDADVMDGLRSASGRIMAELRKRYQIDL